jgi:hypothetical protein
MVEILHPSDMTDSQAGLAYMELLDLFGKGVVQMARYGVSPSWDGAELVCTSDGV